ncbi:hypothetical protein Xen7305DRAFT_00048130 [Xenococcus sp. PCC 7305]|uniref:DUF4278 domain-containing protein n=1 Tax=Xenococcus sp. PCC 7305 TaxID=102125 RepID=UPI0002ABB27E|nr:DUF4278 domain-containing protein [Xenococcus sp. PCC 7305]ELS05074.1 hypothetical protein Xen7305DRAFT_00048130 [Xenococcus sp. PCC 7305]
MQLTYRGVSYQPNPTAEKTSKIGCVQKYRLSEDCDANKVAWIRPITYYVYRGVSYTKCPLVNAKTQLLQ